jgi:hypothetical protein
MQRNSCFRVKKREGVSRISFQYKIMKTVTEYHCRSYPLISVCDGKLVYLHNICLRSFNRPMLGSATRTDIIYSVGRLNLGVAVFHRFMTESTLWELDCSND